MKLCQKKLIQERELYNLIKSPTCFKSTRGRCIDLLLTNSKYSFEKSHSFETGFSDCDLHNSQNNLC